MNIIAKSAIAALLVTTPTISRAQSADAAEAPKKTWYAWVELTCINGFGSKDVSDYTSDMFPIERPESFSNWDAVEKAIGAQAKDELRANGAQCLKLAAVVHREDSRGKAVVARRKAMASRNANWVHQNFTFEFVDPNEP